MGRYLGHHHVPDPGNLLDVLLDGGRHGGDTAGTGHTGHGSSTVIRFEISVFVSALITPSSTGIASSRTHFSITYQQGDLKQDEVFS